jgi:uncharacterized membrane protein
MDKMLAIVFDDERKAYEGARAVKELHNEGSLTVYAASVISKDPAGKVNVKQAADQGPVGTAAGWATGALIGLLGGPAGVAIGAATGMVAGSFYDLAQVGVDSDFLDEVSRQLSPGKTAVIAEIDEEWVTPLDTRVEALGGKVFRRARGEFIDSQVERDMEARKAEINNLKAEYNQATGQAKANLKGKIDAAQKSLDSHKDKLKGRIDTINRESEAKFKSLQEQEAKARGETKAKLDQRLAKAKVERQARVDKLKHAMAI